MELADSRKTVGLQRMEIAHLQEGVNVALDLAQSSIQAHQQVVQMVDEKKNGAAAATAAAEDAQVAADAVSQMV